MRFMSSVLVGVLWAAVPFSLTAQALRIVPTGTHVLQTQWNRPIHLPVKCDQEGNIYFRNFETGITSSPVVRVSQKRDDVTSFSVANDPDLKGASVRDFAVTPDGTVFELVHAGNDVYVVEFSDDGSVSSKTKLEKQFWPEHLAVTPDGDRFLIAGTELPAKDGKPPQLVTAIFDNSGRLVKDLTLLHDPAVLKEPRAGEPRIENYFTSHAILPLVQGETQVGLNGDLYVVRASRPPEVFVLNSNGKFVRSVTVDVPENGMSLGAIQFSDSRIAALFHQLDDSGQVQKRVMAIVDSNRGTTERRYQLADGMDGVFACYDGSSFTFLSTEHGKFAITTAKPQ